MTKNATATLGLLLASLLLFGAAQAHEKHRVILQVNDNDPARMNLVLNNAANLNAYYHDKGEPIEIEIVTYGPGLMMLRDDKSPVKERVLSFAQNFDNVTFAACANTRAKMAKKEGMEIPLVANAKVVPSGVVHAIERQEQGWSYIKP